MKFAKIILLSILSVAAVSCEDLFDPANENNRDLQDVIDTPDYAMGVLGYGYSMLPYDTKSVSDIATDDAVTNDLGSSYMSMALGSWSSNNNPMDQWGGRKMAIQYMNTFLDIVEDVKWSSDHARQAMFVDKLKGEAYALRALNYYYLLMAHGGYGVSGQLLGVPLVLEPEDASSNFNRPRATFQRCMEQIFEDLDAAIDLLPLDYGNIASNDEIPERYREYGAEFGAYNLVFGTYQLGRVSGRIAEAVKAQAALLAASPAFRADSGVTSADAAEYAADVLNHIEKGPAYLDPNGHTWYMNIKDIDDAGTGLSPDEILWRGDKSKGTDSWDIGIAQEQSNFPPSLYGSGNINPTQNLVDAFPMANGYPISDAQSGYDAKNPYEDRDPRLSAYVIYNSSEFAGSTITTGAWDSTDGIGQLSSSTRTGYYMRKLLREDCSLYPNINAQYHFPVRIRYTELFLAYAEAANDAYGPTTPAPNATYSAYDIIKAIRERAGITDGDAYLESVKNDQEKMAELIRNERRIELCFENKRFWDIRRWLLPLNEDARGMRIEQSGGSLSYTDVSVEERAYLDYMHYGPIPYTETLKWSELEQNQGW